MESAIQRSCFDCVMRPDRPFCDLPADALQSFDEIKTVQTCPRGTVLFREGQPGRAVFVLCDGRAKLSVCSESGKRLILRMAGRGEVLGLSASLSGCPYEVTAELLDDSQVAVVKRKDLLAYLKGHGEVCLQVIHLLSEDLHAAYERVRSVGLVRARRTRAARFSQ